MSSKFRTSVESEELHWSKAWGYIEDLNVDRFLQEATPEEAFDFLENNRKRIYNASYKRWERSVKNNTEYVQDPWEASFLVFGECGYLDYIRGE